MATAKETRNMLLALAAIATVLSIAALAWRLTGQDEKRSAQPNPRPRLPGPMAHSQPPERIPAPDSKFDYSTNPCIVPLAAVPWKREADFSRSPVTLADTVMPLGENSRVLPATVATAETPWQRMPGAYATAWAPLAMTHSIEEPPPLELEREADENAGKYNDAKIKLTGNFECGYLPAVEKISDTHFSIDFKNEPTQMFLFKVTGVAGKTVRIDLKNVAVKDASSPGGWWNSLNPVFSYVNDLGALSSFAVTPILSLP